MGWESQWSFSDRYMRATVLSHEIERSFSVLIFGGVLDRFPDLQIVSTGRGRFALRASATLELVEH